MGRFTGHTAELKRSNADSPETFTKVAQVLSISGPGISRDTIDSTDADATNDWRTYLSSYIDGGEITLEVNLDLDAATHGSPAGFLGDFADTTLRNYQVRFPDASPMSTWAFTGKVTGAEPSNPHDGMSTMSVTYKVTSEISFS